MGLKDHYYKTSKKKLVDTYREGIMPCLVELVFMNRLYDTNQTQIKIQKKKSN